jgi:hypothetical protein
MMNLNGRPLHHGDLEEALMQVMQAAVEQVKAHLREPDIWSSRTRCTQAPGVLMLGVIRSDLLALHA